MATRMLRAIGLAAVTAAICLVAFSAAAGAGQSNPVRTLSALDTLEGRILSDINRIRSNRGLSPLRIFGGLTAAADTHSREMARSGFFAHSSADGSSFSRRVQRFYPTSRYSSWLVGENLLWSSPSIDDSRAVDLWMRSPGHRANLLEPRWRQIGLSAMHASSAPGTFGGREVTILTADFGVRR